MFKVHVFEISLMLSAEFKDQVNEWANMTGFLCALGGVCLQRRSPRPILAPPSAPSGGVIERKSNVSFSLHLIQTIFMIRIEEIYSFSTYVVVGDE